MGEARRRWATSAAIVALLLGMTQMPAFASGETFLYDPERDAFIEEVNSWRDPGGRGADLRFNLSSDGSMILMQGYVSPGELRVMDLDMETLAVLPVVEVPHEVRGFTWSETDRWIVAWSRPEGGGPDFLQVFDVPSFEPNGSVPWVDAIDLVEIDLVTFFGYDEIVSVNGRDADGKSIQMFIEAKGSSARSRTVWPGNHTVLASAITYGGFVYADSGGVISLFQGYTWEPIGSFDDAFKGPPLSWHLPRDYQWGFGDADGRVVVSLMPYHDRVNLTVGEGPVTGFTWTGGRPGDFMAALRRPDGGSRLVGWQLFDEATSDDPLELCHLDTPGNVTMMRPDPRGRGHVLVALEDGTLATYRLDIRPIPTNLPIGSPEEFDRPGLEPFRKWRHQDAKGQQLRFKFNHQGSLILLQGFASPGDVRVVNRTLDTVAIIEPPVEDFHFMGFEWSVTDRWLLVWGYSLDGEQTIQQVMMYDVPSFNQSVAPLPGLIENVTYGLHTAEFLPGDQAIALSCQIRNIGPSLVVMDIHNGTIIRKIHKPDVHFFNDQSMDGDDLVGLSQTGEAHTLSPPDWDIKVAGVGQFKVPTFMDVDNRSGWLLAEDFLNLTICTGRPREPSFSGTVSPKRLAAASWTRGREGDLVLAVDRSWGGSNLQLWQTVDRPDLPGMRMLAQLNTSKMVWQMEADPAFPGLMAVSFTDGTFALYHLNVTPYPPPPAGIGGLDIGPIDGPVDVNGTNGDGGDGNGTDGNGTDQGWGSEMSDLFPVLLLVALVALVAVYIWLRTRP